MPTRTLRKSVVCLLSSNLGVYKMSLNKIVTSVLAAIIFCSCGVVGAKQTPPIIRLVLTEGDVIPGIGAIETLGDVAINDSGETLIIANTTNPTGSDDVLLLNGEVIFQEGIAGQLNSPPGAIIAGPEPIPFSGSVFNSLNICLLYTSPSPRDS